MLLADFVGRAHKTTADDRIEPIDLQQVEAFVFGEHYLIKMKNGKSFDVRELDDLLDVLHDEFHLWREQLVPHMQLVGVSKKAFVSANARVLEVQAVQASNFVPAPPVQNFVEKLRRYVTIYNINGGSWDHLSGENL
jgi:hypothetical protein